MDVRMPDGTIIKNVPEGTTQEEILRRYKGDESNSIANIVGGLVRGAGSIGATILTPYDLLVGNTKSIGNTERRSAMDEGLRSMGVDTDSWGFAGGKLVSEIAGTAGVGGVLSKLPLLAKFPTVAGAVQTAGMSGGGNLATRAAGGAITGGTAAGMINPEDADIGAVLGGTMPGAVKVAGKVGNAAGSGIRRMFDPQAKVASILTAQAGMSADDLANAIKAGNVELVPGAPPTTAQAAMNPQLSQLERTLRNRNANPFVLSDQAQDAARRSALAKIGAPSGVNVRDVAEEAGQLISRRAAPQRAAAKADVRAAYEAIDPAGMSRIAAPVKEIDSVIDDLFGPGGGKPAAELSSLVADVKQLTKQTDDLVSKAKIAKGVVDTNKHSLGDAIRIWGGLNTKQGGEVRWLKESDLGKRSGLGSFASNKGKMSLARASEKAYEMGYIPDDDINLLLDKLAEEAGGNPQFSIRMGDAGMARLASRDAPEAPAVLPWRTLENLRQRAGDIVRHPTLGQQREGVAAARIREILDAEFDRAASGVSPKWGENFTDDMITSAQKARKLHAETKQRFDTGPARNLFRYGADNLPRAQGAEVTRGFVNAGNSQVADAQQFMRMVGNDKGSVDAARRYALADLVEFSGPRDKPLSAAKFDGWVKARKPMLDVLFPKDQVKQLAAVRDDLVRAEKAANLGVAMKSNTMQNLEGSSALSRSAAAGLLGNIPVVGKYAGALVGAANEFQRDRVASLLAPVMIDPNLAISALSRQQGLLGVPLDWQIAAARAVPAIAANR